MPILTVLCPLVCQNYNSFYYEIVRGLSIRCGTQVCPRRKLDRLIELPNLFEVLEKYLPEPEITDLQTYLHANLNQQMSAGVPNHNILYVLNEKGAH